MADPMDHAIERFEKAFFTMFQKLGPGLALPADLNLTGPQIMMLYTIVRCEPCQVGRLAQRMEVTPSAITVMIDRLVQNGFVHRKHDENDRRVVLLEATEQAREALLRIRALRSEVINTYLSYLEPHELEPFLQSFEKIAHKMSE
ncbi:MULTISPECIES: MarR family winged helix-turn-helix transcriptional regulator [Paenibacillus]|uniref:MarR family transcriptional regulator n=1 Tax=Paenibacillus elgii TaxID=189691 RepID=A0A165Q4M4_9BACL|nr:MULTISPECIES: MarR family transcriptional regulator [Paenibacillus]KZE73654.1 hypothetical protein AV654_03485 [Paenibacillus elgii]MCM3269617.1 MarR family transcriptional regulator [Paenibacillus elgii]NEN80864.1 MarR family transcriptional regulator [Paenibacillus elgii]PUA39369.1 MarR family transcriptional regulator [Paenibacillus elgii]GLI09583.1 MarR family transcriptional regulator [Paenibacillus tyrfis]